MYKYVGFLNVQNLPRLYVDLFHSLRIKYKCIEEAYIAALSTLLFLAM